LEYLEDLPRAAAVASGLLSVLSFFGGAWVLSKVWDTVKEEAVTGMYSIREAASGDSELASYISHRMQKMLPDRATLIGQAILDGNDKLLDPPKYGDEDLLQMSRKDRIRYEVRKLDSDKGRMSDLKKRLEELKEHKDPMEKKYD
jgi:hypothetical protein